MYANYDKSYSNNAKRRRRSAQGYQKQGDRTARGREDNRGSKANNGAAYRKYHQKKTEPPPSFPDMVCSICGKEISDAASALIDRDGSGAVHFECALECVKKEQALAENERVVYIGKGRFAVSASGAPGDPRKFIISRIVEWEQNDSRADWRQKIAAYYSQIN